MLKAFPSPHFTFLHSTGTSGNKVCLRNGERTEKREKLHFFSFFLFPLKAVHEGSVAYVEWVRCSVALSDITKGNLGPEVCRWGCQSATNIKGSYKNKRKEMDV